MSSTRPPARGCSAYLWGFVIGAAGPVAMGIAMWRELQVELATARANGEECCGLAAIVPFSLVVIVAPFCGLIGAVLIPEIVRFWVACAVVVGDNERDE